MDVNLQLSDRDFIVCTYQYESDPMFGSPASSSGRVVFSRNRPIVAITSKYDTPKFDQMFKSLSRAIDIDIHHMITEPQQQYDICSKYGYLGAEMHFRQRSNSESEFIGETVDVGEKADEMEQYTMRNRQDVVNSIIETSMDDEMYVWTETLVVDGKEIVFGDPLRFYTHTNESFDEEIVDGGRFTVLFNIVSEVYEERVIA